MAYTSANPRSMPVSVPPTPTPTPQPRLVICPYCGQACTQNVRCDRCKGLFEPLSKQASQNAMGPWFIRDEANPFRPGCSFETLAGLVARGKVTGDSVLRGPTTRQFWTLASNVPAVANLLGECHACHAPARAEDRACGSCGASFEPPHDRENLGLSPIQLLPGHASPDQIASRVIQDMQAKPSAGRERELPVMSVAEPVVVLPNGGLVTSAREELLPKRRKQSQRRALVAAGGFLIGLVVVAAAVVVLFGSQLGIDLKELRRLFGSDRP